MKTWPDIPSNINKAHFHYYRPLNKTYAPHKSYYDLTNCRVVLIYKHRERALLSTQFPLLKL